MELEEVKSKIRGNVSFLNATEFAALYLMHVKYNDPNEAAPKLGRDIFSDASRTFIDCLSSDGEIVFSESKKTTFIQYLANLSKQPDSSIRSGGRGKGYFLVRQNLKQDQIDDLSEAEKYFQIFNIVAVEPQPPATAEPVEIQAAQRQPRDRQFVQRERRLYPLLKSWLATQDYQAADISQGKSLGTWGNPDVAGINLIEAFDRLSIELVTIEAKITSLNWRVDIFEAISHRRFANRVYFSYAVKDSEKGIIDKDVRYYAELYRIGILIIVLSDSDYERLIAGGAGDQQFEEETEVLEIFPAPYSEVNLKHQMRFFEMHKITNMKEAFRWGTDN